MVVNCVAYAEGHRIGDIAIEDIGRAREAGQMVWAGLYEPDEPLMRTLQEQLHLHDLAVEDAHRAHQRPKLEEFGDGLFLVLQTAQMEGDKIAFGETHLFVGPDYVVSIRHGASLPYIDVRTRCERSPELLAHGGTWFILYTLVDFVVDQYLPITVALEERLEVIEQEVFEGRPSRDTTERIYSLKRDLMRIKHAVAPLSEMGHHLVRFESGAVTHDVQLYLRDVYDHILRINQNVDTLRELVSAVLEANLSLISVQQNDVMKLLAAWAAIIALPTLIAGVCGMNFTHMPGLAFEYGFEVTMGVMVAISGTLYGLFRRSGWI